MNTILIVLGVTAVATAIAFLLTKLGVFKDDDGNGIPDNIDKAAAETSRRATRVKEELSDVGESVKEVATQAGHVAQAAAGEKRKGRKPSPKRKASTSRSAKPRKSTPRKSTAKKSTTKSTTKKQTQSKKSAATQPKAKSPKVKKN